MSEVKVKEEVMSESEDGEEVELKWTPGVMTIDTSSNKNETANEKLLLLEENRKLRDVIHEMSGRLKFLEGFLAEIYGEKFHEFLAKRERLEGVIGFKNSEVGNERLDGRRSSKSRDLVDLMKIMRDNETKVETENQNGTETLAAVGQQSPPKMDVRNRPGPSVASTQAQARFPVPVPTMESEVVAPQYFVPAETQHGVRIRYNKRGNIKIPYSYFCSKCGRGYRTKHKMELHEPTCTFTTHRRKRARATRMQFI